MHTIAMTDSQYGAEPVSQTDSRRESGQRAATITLEGTYARLRPVGQQDYAYLYDLSLAEENTTRWRYRGVTPSPEGFVVDLWNGVLAQFVMESAVTRERIGLVVAYNADPANGHVFLGVLLDATHRRKVWPLEGVLLFVDYLFQNWAFRKIYAECPEFNAEQFGSGASWLFQEEGRLRSHHYLQGRHWDYIYYALYRDCWEARGAELLERVGS
jgi:RimJ/RimL family protein N-acetyltransferase